MVGGSQLNHGGEGPLIIEQYDATCLAPPRASVTCDGLGNITIDLL